MLPPIGRSWTDQTQYIFRFSLFGLILHVHNRNDDVMINDDLSSQSFLNSTQVFLIDKSTSNVSNVLSITVKYLHLNNNLIPGNVVLAKDIVYNKDKFTNI